MRPAPEVVRRRVVHLHAVRREQDAAAGARDAPQLADTLRGSSQCSSTCVQRTRSKLASSAGIASIVPSSSALGLPPMSSPTYSETYGSNQGWYGLTPQPTSRTRYGPRSACSACASARNQSESGCSSAYVGVPRRRVPAALAGPASRAHARRPGRGEPDREPRQAGDWVPGHQTEADPHAHRHEQPQDRDGGRAPPRQATRERDEEEREPRREPDDAEVGGGLDVGVLDAPSCSGEGKASSGRSGKRLRVSSRYGP